MRKCYTLMPVVCRFVLAVLAIFSIQFVSAQSTVLIDPAGDGGFETGSTFAANGWTVVNGATNQWFMGGVATPSAGTNSAYISDNAAGTTHNYNVSSASVVYLYRDITFPAGQTDITLTFKWKGQGESTWDWLAVWSAPTTVTPTVNVPVAGSGTWANVPTSYPGAVVHGTPPYNLQASYQTTTICLPSAYAGTTRRIVFMWSNDGSLGTEPPVSLDEISLVSAVPAAPAAQPTGLTLTPFSTSQINASFTAAAGSPSYLAVAYPAGATPVNPVNGTTYVVGSSLGTGTVVYTGSTASFSATSLSANTAYDFYVYSYTALPCSGNIYLTASPLTGTASTLTCSGLAGGTYTVGPTGTYTTLTAAVAATAAGITGPVVLELQNNYSSGSETFPIVFAQNACVGAINSIVVRPAAGASGLQISGDNPTAIIDFNGGDFVTIDGRPGGTGSAQQLAIVNANVTGAAVRLTNDAKNNTLKYLDIQGSSNVTPTTSTIAGVVYFGTAGTDANGNDNNSISYSKIHAGPGGNPAVGVYAFGTNTSVGAYNDNNTIDNCEIFDYFKAGAASTGVKLDAGNNAWTITNNHFYQTSSLGYTASATHRALWVTPNTASINNTASGFIITGNFIGGSAPNAGSSAYTMSGAFTWTFIGMDISVGLGTATSVQNNVISNFSASTSSTSTTAFVGISVANGNVNCGTVTGNRIGSTTINSDIQFITAGSAGGVMGIRTGAGGTINIANNIVAGIDLSGTAATIALNFNGVNAAGGTTINITNNKIGSTDIANSINILTSNTTAGVMNGINVSGGTTTTINGNVVANLNSNTVYSGTGTSSVRGIIATTSATSINNNIIRNLSSSSASTASGANCAIVGIAMTSTNAAGCNVTGNTIDSLVLATTSSSAAVQATGLFYSGTATVTNNIARNFIHTFDLANSNPNILLTAIDNAAGANNIVNNMIRLGVKPDGTDMSNDNVTRGISSNSTSATNVYFNSIYIGGANVGGNVKNTYDFIRTATSGTYDIKNNIFINNRSNSGPGSGGKHYVMYFTTNTTGVTVNSNLYQYTGNDGTFAFNGTADVTTYIAGWLSSDAASVVGDPQFINPAADAANVNLHISTTNPTPIEGAGVVIASVTDDFDGQTRSGLTPVDLGADAGNFILLDIAAPVISYTPLAATCNTNDRTLTATISDAGGVPTTGTLRPRIYYRKSTMGTWATQQGTLTSGTGNNGTWDFVLAGSLLTGGTVNNLDVIEYYIIAQDNAGNIGSIPGGVNATNVNTINTPPATPNSYNVAALSGNYDIGSAQTAPFNTLTSAINMYNTACLTGAVTFSLTDASYDNTTETFPILINANTYASATNTLTIKPAAGNTVTITGSVASGALIRFNGADYVTLNGSNNNTTTQDLTISNTNATAPSGIALISLGTGAGATNVTVKNCNISTTVNTAGYGITIGGATPGTAGADNDNVTIQNNIITDAGNGIYAVGIATTGVLDNLSITGNSFTTNTNVSGNAGVRVGQATGSNINQNTINIQTSGTTPVAISLETGFVSSLVSKNLITKVLTTNTGGYGGRGITVGTGTATSNLVIANNMIYGVNGSNWTTFGNSSAMGIVIGEIGSGTGLTTTAGGIQLYYNSINLAGTYDRAGANLTAALYIGTGASALDIRNNAFVNSLLDINAGSAGSKAYAVYSAAANTVFSTIDYNDYFVSGAQGVLSFLGADKTTLADLTIAFGQNTHSVNTDPLFVAADDLHIQGTSPLDGAGTPVSITVDYDGQTRDATTPDIGADELPAPVGIDMKPVTLISPAVITSGCYNTETITVSIKNNSQTTLDLTVNPVTVQVNVTGASTATYSATLNTGTLAGGAVQNVTMVTPGSTLNMSAAGTYSFDLTTTVTGDINTSNNTMNVTRTKIALAAGTIASTPQGYCVTGGAPQLSTTGAAGYTSLQWVQTTTSGSGYSNIAGGTVTPFTVPSAISQTTYYKLVAYCGTNRDSSAQLTVAINNPQVTGTTPGSRCGTGSVNLSATANAGSTLSWYTASTGGLPIGTGSPFATPVINATTTYYVGATSGAALANVGKASTTGADGTNTAGAYLIFNAISDFTLQSVNIYPYAATATAGTVTIALQNSAGTTLQQTTVNVTGNPTPIVATVNLNFNVTTGTAYRLVYLSSVGVTAMYRDFTAAGISFPYTIPGVVSITDGSLAGYYYYFYNWAVTVGCSSARTAVTATVVTPPSLTGVSATPAAICAGQSSTLNVASSNAGYTYSWTPTGGPGSSVSVSPSATTKFYVNAVDNSGGTYNGCANVDSVTVTVNPLPTAVTITPSAVTICPNSPAQLLTASGGTLPSSATIGTGTVQNATATTVNMPPYGNYYTGNRHQMLILASELTAAGLSAGKSLTSLAFDVISNTNALGYKNFTIRIGNTAVTALTTTFLTTPTTLVYTNANFNPTVGWSTHVFSTPFVWNGTSNLVIETYFSNCPSAGCSGTTCSNTGSGISYTQNAVTNQSNTAFTSHVWYYSDGAGCSPETQTTATTSATVRPNMLIGFDNPTTMTWSPTTNLFTDAAATTAYTGTAALSVYAKPSATTTYTATSTTAATCTSTNTATVTMSAAITNSTALAGTAGGAQTCANYDLAVSNNFFNNCNIIATVAPSGASPVSGNVNACVKIDATVQTAPPNNVPYVQRHFDILPASNPTTATSTITLYFSQAEFTAFNVARGPWAALPTSGADAAGIANLRVTQYNGTGTAPGNYTGTAVQIDPVDANITYNATADRWSVTFNATGSGGFYVSSNHFVLPVTLINFKGEIAGEINKLSWTTSTETNNSGFELERSADGRNFSKLTFVATKATNGNSTVALNYSYDDARPLAGNSYYRLKQIDKDGKFSYSNIVMLSRKVTEVMLTSVYPNPATKELNLVITSPRAEKLAIVITDLTGKVIMQRPASVVMGENLQELNVQHLAQGTYLIKAVCASGCETAIHRFVKQ